MRGSGKLGLRSCVGRLCIWGLCWRSLGLPGRFWCNCRCSGLLSLSLPFLCVFFLCLCLCSFLFCSCLAVAVDVWVMGLLSVTVVCSSAPPMVVLHPILHMWHIPEDLGAIRLAIVVLRSLLVMVERHSVDLAPCASAFHSGRSNRRTIAWRPCSSCISKMVPLYLALGQVVFGSLPGVCGLLSGGVQALSGVFAAFEVLTQSTSSFPTTVLVSQQLSSFSNFFSASNSEWLPKMMAVTKKSGESLNLINVHVQDLDCEVGLKEQVKLQVVDLNPRQYQARSHVQRDPYQSSSARRSQWLEGADSTRGEANPLRMKLMLHRGGSSSRCNTYSRNPYIIYIYIYIDLLILIYLVYWLYVYLI